MRWHDIIRLGSYVSPRQTFVPNLTTISWQAAVCVVWDLDICTPAAGYGKKIRMTFLENQGHFFLRSLRRHHVDWLIRIHAEVYTYTRGGRYDKNIMTLKDH